MVRRNFVIGTLFIVVKFTLKYSENVRFGVAGF